MKYSEEEMQRQDVALQSPMNPSDEMMKCSFSSLSILTLELHAN